MIEQIVVHERLLDHCEPLPIEGLEHRQVREGIGAVAVDVEDPFGEGGTDRLDYFEGPARPVLQLHPEIPCAHRAFNRGKQFRNGVLDTEIGADPHGACLASERLPQRLGPKPRVQVPPRLVQGRFCEIVALHRGKERLQILS